jgi:hypothetical protein
VDGEDLFDIHADDVVVDYVVTVPGYPKRVAGRDNLAELYRGYGDAIVQHASSDVYAYYDRDKSVMVLEYTIHGTVVSSGARYLNRFVSVIAIEHRKIVRWRLPRSTGRHRRLRTVARASAPSANRGRCSGSATHPSVSFVCPGSPTAGSLFSSIHDLRHQRDELATFDPGEWLDEAALHCSNPIGVTA